MTHSGHLKALPCVLDMTNDAVVADAISPETGPRRSAQDLPNFPGDSRGTRRSRRNLTMCRHCTRSMRFKSCSRREKFQVSSPWLSIRSCRERGGPQRFVIHVLQVMTMTPIFTESNVSLFDCKLSRIIHKMLSANLFELSGSYSETAQSFEEYCTARKSVPSN